jgi:hypothetical protein
MWKLCVWGLKRFWWGLEGPGGVKVEVHWHRVCGGCCDGESLGLGGGGDIPELVVIGDFEILVLVGLLVGL